MIDHAATAAHERAATLLDTEAACRQAIAFRPGDAQAWYNLADALRALERLPEAAMACRQAFALRPAFADALNLLGCVLADLQRVSEAQAAYRRALTIRPDHAPTWYNLGILLYGADRLPAAEDAYRHALALRPDLAEAHNNLGKVLQALGRFSDAEASYRQALAVRPDFAEAHYNLGSVWKELGRFDDAEAVWRQTLALRADYHDARFSLATMLLSMGRFEEGWPLYEGRYAHPGFVHAKTRSMMSRRQWQGEALDGKSLMIWQEDGLGDMIQFGRYVALLKAHGASHIAIACAAALHRLFAAVDGVRTVVDHDTGLAQSSGYDYWVSLLSVPLHLRTTVDTIPSAVYLRPEPALVESWRSRLAALPAGLRVGLVWKGNPRHHNDANRSLPSLATLAPLWSVPGIHFVSLQKGAGDDEARQPPANQPLLDLGAQVSDLAETAAVVAQLDLLICVDTSVAHLAASLGKPCWVLLPWRDTDWRWMHQRDDSPWYPQTVRLFRQAMGESWPTVVERVRAACAERFLSVEDSLPGCAGSNRSMRHEGNCNVRPGSLTSA